MDLDTPQGRDREGRPARHGGTSWLGLLVMYLLGLLVAAFAALITSYVLYQSGADIGGQFVVYSALTLALALGLWLTRQRRWRGTAAGLASAWVFLLWLMFVWHPWDTMTQEEVDRATAEIVASSFPALYLGDQAGEFDWNSYYLANSQVNLFYGECRASDVEAGCTDWDVEVHNERTNVRIEGDFIAGCQRLKPILGAAAVTLGGYGLDRPSDNIGIFTGPMLVVIRFADDDIGLDEKIAVAAMLRPVGAARPRTLAPPTEAAQAYVERNCDKTK